MRLKPRFRRQNLSTRMPLISEICSQLSKKCPCMQSIWDERWGKGAKSTECSPAETVEGMFECSNITHVWVSFRKSPPTRCSAFLTPPKSPILTTDIAMIAPPNCTVLLTTGSFCYSVLLVIIILSTSIPLCKYQPPWTTRSLSWVAQCFTQKQKEQRKNLLILRITENWIGSPKKWTAVKLKSYQLWFVL